MKVIGLAGWSGAGKTTLLVAVIPILRQRGYSVSTLKHAHHAFELDQPGKDSFRQREAGATEVLIASSNRFALIHELRGETEPALPDLLRRLSPVDLVIIEGFKADCHPKIAIHRAANAKEGLIGRVSHIRGLVSDEPVDGWSAPFVHIDDHEAAADLFLRCAEPMADVIAALEAAGRPQSRIKP